MNIPDETDAAREHAADGVVWGDCAQPGRRTPGEFA
jgi:hypothetical protein